MKKLIPAFLLWLLALLPAILSAQIVLDDVSIPASVAAAKKDTLIPQQTIFRKIELPVESLDSSIFSSLSYDNFLKRNEQLKRPYFLVFYASWCGPCRMMDRNVFDDPRVVSAVMEAYTAKKIDVDDFDGIPLAQQFKVASLPTVIFFDSSGKLLRKMEGLYDVDYFIETLRKNR